MYLFSHIATSLDVTFPSIKKYSTFKSDTYHFCLILNGTTSIEDNGIKYILEKDDIILLYPNTTYKLDYVSDNTLLDLSLPTNFFERLIKPGYKVVCNSAIGKRSDYINLRSILTDIIVAYQSENNQLKMCSLLYALGDCMNETFLVSATEGTSSTIDQHYAERVAKISNYLNTNYPLSINQQMLADYMYLTPQYLSKFIKQNFGLTFSKYLNQIRMQHALEELENTNHSVTYVAFNNGFASTTTFNKLFKEMFNTTPTAYRQKIQEETTRHEYQSLSSLSKFDEHRGYDPVTNNGSTSKAPAHRICIDTLHKDTMRFPWLEIINVGLAKNMLSHNFHEAFLDCLKQFHFRYARFQNIFSEKVLFPIQNTQVYDFTNYDAIMDFFYSHKVYPFIELGNKPEKIAFNLEKAGLSHKYNRLEDDSNYREAALEAILKHSINRYGLDYVSKWKFELWIHQDEFLNLAETPEQYVKQYRAYSSIIHKYLPDTHIGGPGFNASGNIENFISVLYALMKNNITPGFISIYLYSYEPNPYEKDTDQTNMIPFRIISTDPQRLKKVFSHIKGLIRQIMSLPLPIYVTEFNSNLSTDTFIANSTFQAAFITKNALELSEADGLGYWLFTDISNEYLDSKLNNVAGIGLFDNYGIKKPSFYAYEFLTKLGSNLISSGSNYIMTSSNDNKFQILAYHYVHYNKYFCINCREKIGFQNTYSVFEDAEALKLDFEMSNLPAGRYKVRKHILNRQNGSFLDEFLRILQYGNSTPQELLYMMHNLQNSEVDYYKGICVPKQEIFYINSDHNMTLSVSLEPHVVIYISISRKLQT